VGGEFFLLKIRSILIFSRLIFSVLISCVLVFCAIVFKALDFSIFVRPWIIRGLYEHTGSIWDDCRKFGNLNDAFDK
jgi:hypothetical protein